MRTVFLIMRGLFDLRASRVGTYEERDRIMALFGPLALIALIATWLILVYLGYVLIYLGTGVGDLPYAFIVSGSSLLTLAFAPVRGAGDSFIVFSEAGTGLLLNDQ